MAIYQSLIEKSQLLSWEPKTQSTRATYSAIHWQTLMGLSQCKLIPALGQIPVSCKVLHYESNSSASLYE